MSNDDLEPMVNIELTMEEHNVLMDLQARGLVTIDGDVINITELGRLQLADVNNPQ